MDSTGPDAYLSFWTRGKVKTCGATRKPEFPQTRLDWTESSPGSGHVFENIFGSGQVRDKDFGPVQVGVFLTGVSYIFSENLKNKVELKGNMPRIPNLSKYSKYFAVCYCFISGHIHMFVVV